MLDTAIRRAVKASPLTQKDICELAGVDRAALSRIVNGTTSMTVSTAEALADALNLELIIRPRTGASK